MWSIPGFSFVLIRVISSHVRPVQDNIRVIPSYTRCDDLIVCSPRVNSEIRPMKFPRTLGILEILNKVLLCSMHHQCATSYAMILRENAALRKFFYNIPSGLTSDCPEGNFPPAELGYCMAILDDSNGLLKAQKSGVPSSAMVSNAHCTLKSWVQNMSVVNGTSK